MSMGRKREPVHAFELSVAIRFFWHEILTYGGVTQEVYKHAVAMIAHL